MFCFHFIETTTFRFQFAGEVAYDMLAPGPSVRCRLKHRRRRLRYQLPRHCSAAPADMREGVANAYMVVREVCLCLLVSVVVLLVGCRYYLSHVAVSHLDKNYPRGKSVY